MGLGTEVLNSIPYKFSFFSLVGVEKSPSKNTPSTMVDNALL